MLRAATRTDAAAIAALHAESWRATYRGAMRDDYLDGEILPERLRFWEERFTVPAANQSVLVALDGEQLVGFACAYGADDATWGTQLDNLHVARAEQGRGVGARLLAAVARWTRAARPDAGLYLWVLEQNVGARRFYTRLGALDVGGDVWATPDGSAVPTRRYVWPAAALARLAGSAER